MLQMEHVVSRADLLDANGSPSPSPEPDALERFRALGHLDFAASSQTQEVDVTGEVQGGGEDDGDEGLEFQLFAAPKGGETKATEVGETHRIRLKSPSVDPERIGFLRPHRSPSYYYATPLSEEEKGVALRGDQVLACAKVPWPGSAYGWKVLHLPPFGLSKDLRTTSQSILPQLTGAESRSRRTRPGKKYRIKLRRKAAEGARKKEERRKVEEDKVAAEKEKRTRRNREKKVKRKAKEKAKKEDGIGGDAEGEAIAG